MDALPMKRTAHPELFQYILTPLSLSVRLTTGEPTPEEPIPQTIVDVQVQSIDVRCGGGGGGGGGGTSS